MPDLYYAHDDGSHDTSSRTPITSCPHLNGGVPCNRPLFAVGPGGRKLSVIPVGPPSAVLAATAPTALAAVKASAVPQDAAVGAVDSGAALD